MGNKQSSNEKICKRHSMLELRGSKRQTSNKLVQISSEKGLPSQSPRRFRNMGNETEDENDEPIPAKFHSSRHLSTLLADNNANPLVNIIKENIIDADIKSLKCQRENKHEDSLFNKINNYREENGLKPLIRTHAFANEMEEICICSLKKGGFNTLIHRKLQKNFKSVNVMSENSLFTPINDNNMTNSDNFSAVVINKWVHSSTMDSNLKREEAEKCSICIMGDGTAYCVFMLLYSESTDAIKE